jgi:cell division septation protein DedD
LTLRHSPTRHDIDNSNTDYGERKMTELFKMLGTGNLGFGGLAVVLVILVVTGGLVPGALHKRMLKDKDDQIEEWRKTHVADLERNREQAIQITRLLDASRTTTHLIHSMQQEVAREIEHRSSVEETWARDIAADTRANVESQLYDRHAALQPAAPEQRAISRTAAEKPRRSAKKAASKSQPVKQPRKRTRSAEFDFGLDDPFPDNDDDSDGDGEIDEMG